MSNKKYIGFIYMWTNVTNNKKYIGSHIGQENDGYVGSGIYFKRAYNKNPENFNREILEYVYDEKSIKILETKHLNAVDDIITNPEYYNLTNKAQGGSNHNHLTNDEKTKMYNIIKFKKQKWYDSLTVEEKNALFEKQQQTRNNKSLEEKMNTASKRIKSLKNKSVEEKKDIANKKRESWKNSPKLKKHSESTRKRRLLEEQNKTIEEKNKFKEKCKEAYKNRSKKDLETIKNIVSKKSKDFWSDPTNLEINKNRISKMLETKANKKLRYITKDQKNKQVPESELSKWLDQGWVLGMFRPRR